MIRTRIIHDYNLFYDESLPGAEDFDFFIRATRKTKLANIDEPELFTYRRTGKNASLLLLKDDIPRRIKFMERQFLDRLSMEVMYNDLKVLCQFSMYEGVSRKNYGNRLMELEVLLDKIVHRNQEMKIYDSQCLNVTMKHRWFTARQYLAYITPNISKDTMEVWENSKYHDVWMD